MDRQGPPNSPPINLLGVLIGLDNETDAMTSLCLDRKEVQCAPWQMHIGTGWPVFYIQDIFFWYLAGRSVPTRLAIVRWIGY